MKKMLKKATALLVIMLMFTIVLAACNDGENETVKLEDLYRLNKTTTELNVKQTSSLLVMDDSQSETIYQTIWTSANPSIVEVSAEGFITGVSAGITTVTAKVILEGKEPAQEVLLSCEVTVKESVIPLTGLSFSEASTQKFPNEAIMLDLIFTPSNATNQGVVWASSNEAVVTVNADSAVAVTHGVGTAVITATSLDGGFMATYTVTVVSPVDAVESLSIKKTLSITEGNSSTISPEIKPADAMAIIEWTSSDTSVATVFNGEVTAIKAGKATITATINDFVTQKVATCTVTVKAKSSSSNNDNNDSTTTPKPTTPTVIAAKSVVLDKTSMTIEAGDTKSYKFVATVTPSNTTQTGTWSSSNPSVASVNPTTGEFTVAATASGFETATITYKIGNVQASAVVVAMEKSEPGSTTPTEPTTPTTPTTPTDVNASYVSLDTISKKVAPGGNFTIKASLIPATSNETISFTSSNTAVATVSQTGIVTALSKGTATITARTSRSGVSAACTVTVEETAATNVTVSINFSQASSIDLVKGSTITASVSFSPAIPAADMDKFYITMTTASNAVSIRTNPLNPSSNNSFLVTAENDGTAKIECIVYDSSAKYNFKYNAAYLNVNTPGTWSGTNPAQGVSLSRPNITTYVGTSSIITANLTDRAGYPNSDDGVVWTSSNNNVVSVSGSGFNATLSANSIGTAYIYAKLMSNLNVQAMCIVTVKESSSVSGSVIEIIPGTSRQLTATNLSMVFTWQSLSSYITVDNKGYITVSADAAPGLVAMVSAQGLDATGSTRTESFNIKVVGMDSGGTTYTGATYTINVGATKTDLKSSSYVPYIYGSVNATAVDNNGVISLGLPTTSGIPVTGLKVGTAKIYVSNASATEIITINVVAADILLTTTYQTISASSPSTTLMLSGPSGGTLNGYVTWSVSGAGASNVIHLASHTPSQIITGNTSLTITNNVPVTANTTITVVAIYAPTSGTTVTKQMTITITP